MFLHWGSQRSFSCVKNLFSAFSNNQLVPKHLPGGAAVWISFRVLWLSVGGLRYSTCCLLACLIRHPVACVSSLQVANQTLHTDRPDLPECFQLSVLSWIPCIYLWAVSPIYLFYLKRNSRGYIMMSIMNRFKTVRGHDTVSFIYAGKQQNLMRDKNIYTNKQSFLFCTSQRYVSESVTLLIP